jgi:hypothetical protein
MVRAILTAVPVGKPLNFDLSAHYSRAAAPMAVTAVDALIKQKHGADAA